MVVAVWPGADRGRHWCRRGDTGGAERGGGRGGVWCGRVLIGGATGVVDAAMQVELSEAAAVVVCGVAGC